MHPSDGSSSRVAPQSTWASLAARALTVLVLHATTVRADSENVIAGIVVDSADRPIAGAWVDIRPTTLGAWDSSSVSQPVSNSRTGRDGAWQFQGLPSGAWIVTIVASDPPRTDDAMRLLAAGEPDSDHSIGRCGVARLLVWTSAAEAETKSHFKYVRVALEGDRHTYLSGRVSGFFDPTRYAYQIEVRAPPKYPEVLPGTEPGKRAVGMLNRYDATYSTVPQVDGRFSIPGLVATDEALLSVTCITLQRDPLLSCICFQDSVGAIGEDQAVVIALRGQSQVELVATHDGSPPAGQTVFALWDDLGRGAQYIYASSGRATVLLVNGGYVCQAVSGNIASALLPLSIGEAGNESLRCELINSHSYVLQVKSAEGLPVDNAIVRLGTNDTASLAHPCRVVVPFSGQFQTGQLPPGYYDVELEVPGSAAVKQRCEFGLEREITILVPPAERKQ
jgi:hypothetical protein